MCIIIRTTYRASTFHMDPSQNSYQKYTSLSIMFHHNNDFKQWTKHYIRKILELFLLTTLASPNSERFVRKLPNDVCSISTELWYPLNKSSALMRRDRETNPKVSLLTSSTKFRCLFLHPGSLNVSFELTFTKSNSLFWILVYPLSTL